MWKWKQNLNKLWCVWTNPNLHKFNHMSRCQIVDHSTTLCYAWRERQRQRERDSGERERWKTSQYLFSDICCFLAQNVQLRPYLFADMDDRIFNVRTFLCMRIHTGLGHTENESAQHFDSQIFLVLRMGFEPLPMESIGSRGRHSTNWATTSP